MCVGGWVLKFANECYKQNKTMDIECIVLDRLTLRERGTIMNHVVGLVLTQSLKEGHFILPKNSLVVIFKYFLAKGPFFPLATPRRLLVQ